MLDELHVQNVALIREATFAPAQGLTVVTGETGAGKTALLSAIKLLVGERADASTVREGAQGAGAVVEGRFFLSADADNADDGHIACRKVSADGRSRVSIDGSMSTVRQLADQLGATVDLCGQHEHQHLLKPANHAAMLDAWAGDAVANTKTAYIEAFNVEQAAAAELARVREASQASAAQLEEARFTLARIDEVNPTIDEYDELMAELPKIENAEALAQASDGAYWGLSGDGGAIEAVNSAIASLESLTAADAALEPLVSSLTDASYILEDASRDLREYRDGIDHDPHALERLQERASALQGLMRAFGPRMEDVIERRDAAAKLIESVDDSSRVIAQAETAHADAEAKLVEAAKAFDDARKAAAPKFGEQVNAQMARLEMGGAELIVHVDPLERAQWTRGGASKVEFMYRAGAGMTPRPLARIASGGEVSRVMLACKVVLGEADARDTLVFDEVDAGVGGSVAVALAAVLADLAKTHQVIVVTHLAQVAVRGERHFMVKKTAGAIGNESEGANAAEAAIPETTLCELDEDERVREIARMLSGDASEASLAHAKEMLKNVR